MGRSRYLLVALGLAASQPALASDFTANIGMMSDYIFRGVKQNTSASAFAGLDFEHDSGLYVGTWAAEVGDGIEYDLYAGFSGSVGDFSYGIGYTGYFYTDDFDDTYQEINLTAGYSLLSLEYSRALRQLRRAHARLRLLRRHSRVRGLLCHLRHLQQ
jgi:uncharacterized protein (TIGR02001 family)